MATGGGAGSGSGEGGPLNSPDELRREQSKATLAGCLPTGRTLSVRAASEPLMSSPFILPPHTFR